MSSTTNKLSLKPGCLLKDELSFWNWSPFLEDMLVFLGGYFSGWWQLKYFLCSTLLGEDSHFDRWVETVNHFRRKMYLLSNMAAYCGNIYRGRCKFWEHSNRAQVDKENAEAEMKRKEEAVQVPDLFGMIHLQGGAVSPNNFCHGEEIHGKVFLFGVVVISHRFWCSWTTTGPSQPIFLVVCHHYYVARRRCGNNYCTVQGSYSWWKNSYIFFWQCPMFDTVSYSLYDMFIWYMMVSINSSTCDLCIPANLIFPIALFPGACLLVPVPSLLLKVSDKNSGQNQKRFAAKAWL